MRASARTAAFGLSGGNGPARRVKPCSRATPLVSFSSSEEKEERGFRNGRRAPAWRQVRLRVGGKALKREPHECSGMKQGRKGTREVRRHAGEEPVGGL
jgi:hypothetical protein